jgi:hypothetical protein
MRGPARGELCRSERSQTGAEEGEAGTAGLGQRRRNAERKRGNGFLSAIPSRLPAGACRLTAPCRQLWGSTRRDHQSARNRLRGRRLRADGGTGFQGTEGMSAGRAVLGGLQGRSRAGGRGRSWCGRVENGDSPLTALTLRTGVERRGTVPKRVRSNTSGKKKGTVPKEEGGSPQQRKGPAPLREPGLSVGRIGEAEAPPIRCSVGYSS